MRFSSRILASAAAFAVTCAVSAAAYYYRRRNTEINEVMVFCKLQFNAYNYFDKLMSYLENSKSHIDVCMPGIHNAAIQGRLVKILKQKNVKVRIVMDREGYNDFTEVFINELIEAGAEIKCKSEDQMHKLEHKFCLVDGKVLMTGTLDWGQDRSMDHWNYVYITSKNSLVEPVKRRFQQIWDKQSSELEQSTETAYSSGSNSSMEMPSLEEISIDLKGSDTLTLRKRDMTPELFIM